MSAAAQSRIRPLGRGTSFGGMFATLLIHVALAGLIYFAHVKAPPPAEVPRDLIVTQLVALGKPREKFWLPRIVEPPKPKVQALKVTEDPNAAAAPKEAPKLTDNNISKDMRRALERAKMLANAAASDEPAEGSLTGSPLGRATQGQEGDVWATQVDAAIRSVWVTPVGLISDAELQGLRAKVRISVSPEGKLSNPVVKQSSGNQYFDDSCVQAVKTAGAVPPPPPGMKNILLTFEGKNLAQ